MTERVLIAGGGPAGLLAALVLARRGIPVVVLEQHDVPAPHFCPATLDDAAIAALDRVGVLDEVRQHCLTVERTCRIDTSTSSVDIDTSVRLHCEQAHLVASLERALALLPRTQVRYSAPVRSVRLGAGGVVVATSDEKLRGHWLIGADGAQSTVRRCVGVDAVATADSLDIVVGRAASDLATASPELEPATFVRTSAGDAAVLQTSAMWRVIIHAELWQQGPIQEWLHLGAGLPVETRVHRVQPQVASAMVVERVALVGDAAAVYDPASPRASVSAGLADAALIAARVADQLDGIVTEDDVARMGEQRRHVALSVSARSPGGTQRHPRRAVGGGAHT